MSNSLGFGKLIEFAGVFAPNFSRFHLRQRSKRLLQCIDDLLIGSGQCANGPITTEHHSIQAKLVYHMLHIGP